MIIHEAIFRIESPNAAIICEVLKPEEEEDYSGRTQGICTRYAENILEVSIRASDLSALRAALNTWLRLIQVSSEMINRTKI